VTGPWRVAVTTAADSAERLAGLLAASGLVPVILPCIRIEPGDREALDRIRSAAPGADWVLATSGRALQVTWPEGMAETPPVAAVGDATAEVATALGATVRLVGQGTAVDLAKALASVVSGSVVVHPVAGGADPEAASILADAGAVVIGEVAYTSVPVGPRPDPVDGAVFGSPSAVAGWLSTRDLEVLEAVAAMGPTTAAALADAGRPADIVPDPPRLDSIVAALAAAAATERTPTR
jgi:uroporphyrinogen-III synthase